MDKIDTPPAPAAAGQPPEPTAPEPEVQTQSGWIDEPEQRTEPPLAENAEPPIPPSPPQLTPDQIMEQASERAFQKMASWQGRRDKDLFDNIGGLIDSRLRTTTTPPPESRTDPATMLENPDAWARTVFPRILDEEVSRRSNAEQQFNTELIRHATAVMDGDPLFQDQNLGNAVVEEIQKGFGTVNRSIGPALAAQLLVNGALANVVRKQAQTRTNPLAGNKPVTGPMGTVTAPAPKPAKAKPVKLSDEARALAKRWNYSEEDIARVFGEQ